MPESIHAALLRLTTNNDFSGVAFVKHGDHQIAHEAFGLAHRGFHVPNQVSTRFDIASVTKTFTAAAIMQLIDRGRIALDTRVMPFIGIGDTAISDEVTVFHCLTHTSGIGDDADEEAGEDYEVLFVDKPNYSIRETKDFLPGFIDKEPNFAPGEGVRYNNAAFVLLGLVIEKATGLSYRDYVRQHIFAPADMTGADFCAMDGVCENVAEGYKRIEHEAGSIEWRKNIYSYPPVGSPDGGATVTALDLDRFIRAIRSGTLMSAQASEQLLSPHVKQRDTATGTSLWNGFAFEFEKDTDGEMLYLGKDGINAGVCAYVRYYPATDTTCVLLSNNESDVWSMHDELQPLLSQG
jgi:CubicO group peptidase (beta-lactamase class C family)